MIKAAVLGSPIEHSLSPVLHNHAYKVLGVVGEYQKLEVKSGELASFIASNRDSGWTGFSLTMPLKEEVVELDIEIEESARNSKSANTLLIPKDGSRPRALSTDKLAFDRLLKVNANSRIALLGGGGTARSVLASLNQRVESVDVFLRNPAKGRALGPAAPQCKLTISEFTHFEVPSLADYDFLISTVPAGASDELAAQISQAAKSHSDLSFVEVLYNPWPTDLLATLRSQGASCVDGLDLLVEQALDQIALFVEVDFDYSKMRKELLKVGLEALHH